MFSIILDVNMVYFSSLYEYNRLETSVSREVILGSTATCDANFWRDYVVRLGGATFPGSNIRIPKAQHLVGSLNPTVIVTIETPKTATATLETLLLCQRR